MGAPEHIRRQNRETMSGDTTGKLLHCRRDTEDGSQQKYGWPPAVRWQRHMGRHGTAPNRDIDHREARVGVDGRLPSVRSIETNDVAVSSAAVLQVQTQRAERRFVRGDENHRVLVRIVMMLVPFAAWHAERIELVPIKLLSTDQRTARTFQDAANQTRGLPNRIRRRCRRSAFRRSRW